MRFLFACGGTAGHINPAIAVAEKLRERYPDAEFLFIGAGRPLEKKLVPAAKFKLENLTVTGFSREISLAGLKKNAAMIRNLRLAKSEARRIIDTFDPDVVFGTGGYVCYPVLKTAAKLGVPTAIHESNAVPGMTTKMLSGRVDRVMSAFPGTERHYRKPKRVTVTGTPVRADFGNMTKAAAKRRLGIAGKPLVVSFWGSLGAARMNEMTADFIKRNCATQSVHHIHATGGGEEGVARMMDMLRERGVREIPPCEDIRPYIENMGRVMTAADLIICRSGASTTAELTGVGCPAILVPSPNVTGNHQEKNARALEREGAAKVVLECECSGDTLFELTQEFLRDGGKLAAMSKASAQLGIKDAADKIADILVAIAGE